MATVIYRRAQRRRFIRRIGVVVGSLWLQIGFSRLTDNASTKLFVSQLMPKLPMLSKNSTAEQAIARAEKGRQEFDVALPLGDLAAGFAFLAASHKAIPGIALGTDGSARRAFSFAEIQFGEICQTAPNSAFKKVVHRSFSKEIRVFNNTEVTTTNTVVIPVLLQEEYLTCNKNW